MNFKKIAVFSIAIAAAAVAAAPAFAACDPAPTFGTVIAEFCPQNAAEFGGGFCAVRGTAPVMSARFWGWNKGNFAVDGTTNCVEATCGSDNGTWQSDDLGPGGDGTITWLLDSGVPNTFILSGAWDGNGARNLNVDGCPTTQTANGKARPIMLVGITDANGAFAIAWEGNVPGTKADYDFSFINGSTTGDMILRPVPSPFVTASSKINTTDRSFTIRSLALADISNGLYGDSNLVPTEAVQGFKIYTRIVARNAATPAKDRGAWTAATGTLAFGAPDTPITVSCATDSDVYFAFSVVGNSGWEGAFVGTGRRGQCGPTVADPANPKYKPVPRGGKNQLNPNN